MASYDVEMLRGIVGLIERNGWWDGKEARPPAFVQKQCVATAFGLLINTTTSVWSEQDTKFYERLGRTLGVYKSPVATMIPEWNDAQPNGQVVIERLSEIADKWEAEDSWAE